MKTLVQLPLLLTALLWPIAGIQTASSYIFRSANRRQAKILESSMDLHEKPCADFYKYACGKWEENLVEQDKFHETISMVDYYSNREMARVLQRMNPSSKPAFIMPVWNFYKSCMAVDEYRPLEYLRWLKYEEGMKWASLWQTSKANVTFDWLGTLAIMRKYGLNGILLEMITMQQKDNSLKTILDLDKPVQGGGMTPLSFSNLEVLIKATGVPMSESALQTLWNEISGFEKKLAKLDEIEDDDEGNQLLKIKELPLDWLKQYIKLALNVSTLNEEMTVSIQNVPYMLALDKLLKRHEPRLICKYLEIRFLWNLHLEGPTNFAPEDCAQNARSLIPLAMHWLFEHNHPELAAEKPKVHALFRDIVRHFKLSLQSNANSFNASTLEYLLAKLDSVQLKVNNLPRNQTVKTLTEFYKDLQLNSLQFYANHLKLMRFNFKIAIDNLYVSLPTDIKEFFFLENSDTASSSSPYFIQRSNVAVVPLTLLQQPIYHPDLEDIYKYSSLGFLLAHEITHGFDATGLDVDFSGKMGSPQYDNILSNPRFDKNYNCLLEFNPAVVDEKIADVSGLKLAYHAFFQLHPESVNQTRRIYGSDMPIPKVFFLNFAQFFCGIAKESEHLDITEHGLDHDRVIDALSNFPEFSKVFSCQLTDAMNPGKSCHLWR